MLTRAQSSVSYLFPLPHTDNLIFPVISTTTLALRDDKRLLSGTLDVCFPPAPR